jgi:hypothetical protein
MRKLIIILGVIAIAFLMAALRYEHVRFASFQAENHQRIAKLEDEVRALRTNLEAMTKPPLTQTAAAPSK